MLLKDPADLTSQEVSYLAVGVKKASYHSPQLHTAFIYHVDQGQCRLSHLAWHHAFKDEPWDGTYWWASTGLHSVNRTYVASWLQSFASNPQLLGYGFSSLGCAVTEDNSGSPHYVPGNPGKGLTCASFIIFVLEYLGYELILEDEWPARAEDLVWQREIIELLRKTGKMSPEELAGIAADVGSVRFKPLEVVGSATESNWPVNFADAEALARRIQAECLVLQ